MHILHNVTVNVYCCELCALIICQKSFVQLYMECADDEVREVILINRIHQIKTYFIRRPLSDFNSTDLIDPIVGIYF